MVGKLKNLRKLSKRCRAAIAAVDEDEDTSLHIEGFYQYQVTDNIAITLLSHLDYSA